jgi:membrane-associated phospholipid phosphatase
LKRKALFRYSLIVLSLVLGAAVHFTNLDNYQVPYVAALQQAAVQANVMGFLVLYAHIGDSIVWIGLGLLLLALYSNRPRKALKLAVFLAIVGTIVTVLRLAFPVQRPYVEFPSQVHAFSTESSPSFPSGHVAPSAGGFYLIAGNSRRLQMVFAAMVVLLATARIAAGVHYFTDVIGSALFSYPIAAIINDMKLFERFKDELPK